MKVNKIGLVVMIILLVFAIFVAITGDAKAQTFIGGGVKIAHTTNTDSTFPGGYVEGGLKLPANFQARFLGEFSNQSELATIFTRDKNIERVATYELRFRPSLRFNSPVSVGYFKPFVEGGLDFYRQGFKGIGADCYGGNCGYGQPKLARAGLNPFAGAGVRVGGYEGAYSRIFADQGSWNISRLEGHRASFSYERHLFGPVGFKAGVETDFVTFREAYGRYTDYYRERDNVFRGRVGFTFGGGSK